MNRTSNVAIQLSGSEVRHTSWPEALLYATWISAFLGVGLMVAPKEAAAQTASEVIAKTDGIMFPQRFAGIFQMDVEREDGGHRLYEMQINRRGTSTLLFFQKPEVEKGRKLLRVGEDMWMMLPNVKRPVRVSAKQNLMGGDFNNNDVLRLSLTEDFNATFGESTADTWQVVLTAKNGSITYAKVIAFVDKKTYIPLRYDYYTESGKHVKTMTYGKPGNRGDGTNVPLEWTMKNLVTGKSSVMTIKRLMPNEGPGPEAFQLNNLSK